MSSEWGFLKLCPLIKVNLLLLTKYSAFNRRAKPSSETDNSPALLIHPNPGSWNRNQLRRGMKRTNCPKFFVRRKVDNSGSCENISTRSKIYCYDFPENAKCSTFCMSGLKRQKAFLLFSFICLIYLWFPRRGGAKIMHLTLSGCGKWRCLEATWFVSA